VIAPSKTHQFQRKSRVNERLRSATEFAFINTNPVRLDKFLVEHLPDLSRNRIQNLIKEGNVTVDGMLPHKSGQILAAGCSVAVIVPPPKEIDLQPESIPLDIIFENKDLMVVNKPAGMVVHPSPGHYSGTLVHAALAHAPEMEGIGGELRPGVVHRLDKYTSGLILLAKNDRAHRFLQDQFRLRKIVKIYIALVDGKPPTPTGRIEASIARSVSARKQMAVVPAQKGRESVSEYRVIREFSAHTLVEVHPITGRTHQIRLHMAFIGCPVAGDTVYGRHHPSIPLDRYFLHAERITVHLPGDPLEHTFEAPLPAELQTVLAGLET
jgi:23S rRNA pseudouridine1911/1915/1917 synthase